MMKAKLLPAKFGTYQTLQEMKRLTIEAIHSQIPRDFIVAILQKEYVLNPDMLASYLFDWLRGAILIVDEFEELLRSPLILLNEISMKGYTSGDCDDCAMVSAALLASSGANVRFRATEQQSDGSYGHVYTEFMFPRRDAYTQFDITVCGYLPLRENDLIMELIS